MFTQLATPIPVHSLSKGAGLAFAVIDYGPEHHLIWVTALDDGGAIWCLPNPDVRVQANFTLGRSREEAPPANDAAADDGRPRAVPLR